MLTPEHIFKAAKAANRRIGIGSLQGSERVQNSVKVANEIGYGKAEIFYDPVSLAQALKDGRIDAAVRGDLDSNKAMHAVKEVFGLERILRVAMVQPRGEHIFFLAPVGIDEGANADEKLEFVELAVPMLRRMGIEPRIGIMSGGRISDLGRSAFVDKTINEAQVMVGTLKSKGYDAEDVQILIEDAVQNKDLIIAPDGISGNLIFRCIHLVDGGRSMGAPILNIPKVFIDTSRAKPDYIDSIALASALAGGPMGP